MIKAILRNTYGYIGGVMLVVAVFSAMLDWMPDVINILMGLLGFGLAFFYSASLRASRFG